MITIEEIVKQNLVGLVFLGSEFASEKNPINKQIADVSSVVGGGFYLHFEGGGTVFIDADEEIYLFNK